MRSIVSEHKPVHHRDVSAGKRRLVLDERHMVVGRFVGEVAEPQDQLVENCAREQLVAQRGMQHLVTGRPRLARCNPILPINPPALDSRIQR